MSVARRLALFATVSAVALATQPCAAQQQSAWMLPVQGPASPSGSLPFTPPLVINATDPAYGLSSSASAAVNRAALQRVMTTACARGNALISLPSGDFSVDVSSGIALNVNCTGVSGQGAGHGSTIFHPSGTGNHFLAFTPPAGQARGGFGAWSGFTISRTDNPASGDGILFDHTQRVTLTDVESNGNFVDVECNTCLDIKLLADQFSGTNSNAGSTMGWVHHTVATVTATGTNTGSTIGISAIPASPNGVYIGQKVTGDASIVAGSTVTAFGTSGGPVSGPYITISTPYTGGGPGASVTLTATDPSASLFNADASTHFESGSSCETTGCSAGGSYDHALVINDVDGMMLGDSHIGWTRLSSVLVQPGYCGDNVDNISSSADAYFEASGTYGIEFEPCGGWTTTAAAGSSGTTLNIVGTPPSNVNGYNVLANGVPGLPLGSATTVSSGGTTTTLTLSQNINALGVTAGEAVTFYPTYTGAADGAHNIHGLVQGQGVAGVLLNDPYMVESGLHLKITGSQTNQIISHAGSYNNMTGSEFNAGNQGNSAGNSTVLVDGDSYRFQVGGMFGLPAHNPNFNFQVQGQADYNNLADSMLCCAAQADVSLTGGNGTHTTSSPSNATWASDPGFGHFVSLIAQTFIAYQNTGAASLAFVPGAPASPLTAAGTTQGTALAIFDLVNPIGTCASGAGVLLPSTAIAGARYNITNNGANNCLVYPPSSAQINALGNNVGYSLTVGATMDFIFQSATQIVTH